MGSNFYGLKFWIFKQRGNIICFAKLNYLSLSCAILVDLCAKMLITIDVWMQKPRFCTQLATCLMLLFSFRLQIKMF